MAQTFISHKAERFTIEDKPIHSGGEGAIYRVLGTSAPIVAKIYHTTEKARMFEQKILYMVNNSPFGNGVQALQSAIIWPQELLFENNVFVGYIMPMVDQAIKLFSLNQPNFPRPNHGTQWQKFSRMNSGALLIRLKICYNLAKAIDLLHQTGKYTLVDLKPENILVKPNGHFSLIDLDSIQICEKKRLLFRATAYTPEYAPPEFHQGMISFSSDAMPVSFDNFAFAVILYQLLFAIHPFQASHNQYTTLEENIRNSLFVHGRKKQQLHVIPKVHQNFTALPQNLKKLFERALDNGSINPAFRPAIYEWAQELLFIINELQKGASNNSTSPAISKKSKNNRMRADIKQKVNNHLGIRVSNDNLRHHQFAAQTKNTQPSTINTQSSMNTDNAVKKRNLKWAVYLFIVAFSLFALYDIVSKTSPHGGQINTGQSKSLGYDISGQYYGFIKYDDRPKQVVYLHIKHFPEDKSRFALQLISGVDEHSFFDELHIDLQNNTVSSQILGDGLINRSRAGMISLYSNHKSTKSWYFEK